MKRFYSKSIEDTRYLAAQLATLIDGGMVIILDGPLGSGKTSFTQAFGKALGIERAIKSPTYMIVKEYLIEHGKMIHIDAYRLEDGGTETIDFLSYLNEESIILIEWSEFLYEFLPENHLKIQFIPQENINERAIVVTAEGLQKEQYLELISQWEGVL